MAEVVRGGGPEDGSTGATSGQAPQHQATVLVVDDRRDNLIVLQGILAEYLPSCTVLTASSPAEGLQVASGSRLDAALIDVQMPGMNGIDMCRELKRTAATATVPVMLMTSHTTEAATRAQGLEAGADDFIHRPIDNVELVARIQVMLRVKRAEDALRDVNVGLEDRVRERTQELQRAMERQGRLSRSILTAQEEERARLARELHDELGQTLSAIPLELGWLQECAAGAGPELASSCEATSALAHRAAEELRRICRALRPPLLDDFGLDAAVRQLVEEHAKRTSLKVELTCELGDVEQALSPEVSLCTYRIVQESLHNVSRHSGASSVKATLSVVDGELVASIRDDGRGFEHGDLPATGGLGIAGMRERAHLAGGVLDVRSERKRGTTVTLRVPLPPVASEGERPRDESG